jgi:hypothetical protein
MSSKVGYFEISQWCGVSVEKVKYHHKRLEKELGQSLGTLKNGKYEFSPSEQSSIMSRVQDRSKKTNSSSATPHPSNRRSAVKFSANKQRNAFNQRFDYYIDLLNVLKTEVNQRFDSMEGMYLTQVNELKELAAQLDEYATNCKKWMDEAPYNLPRKEEPPKFPCIKNVVELTIEDALENGKV